VLLTAVEKWKCLEWRPFR